MEWGKKCESPGATSTHLDKPSTFTPGENESGTPLLFIYKQKHLQRYLRPQASQLKLSMQQIGNRSCTEVKHGFSHLPVLTSVKLLKCDTCVQNLCEIGY